MSVPQIGEAGYARVAFDNYRTPAWATEYLLTKIRVRGPIWECAAGDLDMVKPLRAAGHEVFATDIRDLPYLDAVVDFVGALDWRRTLDKNFGPCIRAVITNPPYTPGLLHSFIERALAVVEEEQGMVAMLLGFDSDVAGERRDVFKHPAFQYKVYLPKRITWVGMEKRDASGRLVSPRQIHCWMVWNWTKDPATKPIIIYP